MTEPGRLKRTESLVRTWGFKAESTAYKMNLWKTYLYIYRQGRTKELATQKPSPSGVYLIPSKDLQKCFWYLDEETGHHKYHTTSFFPTMTGVVLTKEHKDDSFRNGGEQFQEILQSCLRLFGYICFHIVL